MKIILKTLLFAAVASINSNAQNKPRWEKFEKQTIEGTKIGVFDNQINKEIIPPLYDKIPSIGDGKFMVVKDQRVGYIDTTGKITIAPQYMDGINFDQGRSFVFNGKKWQMINESGQPVTQPIFDDVMGLSDGIGRVVIAGKIGFVNGAGKQIIVCKYKEAYDCAFGLILAYSDFKDVWGDLVTRDPVTNQVVQRTSVGVTKKVPIIYNKLGAIIYRGQPDEHVEFTPTGKMVVNKTTTYTGFRSVDRSQMLDNTGKIIIPYENNWYMDVRDYAIKITVTDGIYGIGILDHDGKVLLKPNFREIDWYKDEESYAKIYFKDSNKFFYIDVNGKCQEYEGVGCPQ